MTSADGAAIGDDWPGSELPIGGVPPPLVALLRGLFAAALGALTADRLPPAGGACPAGGAWTIGIGVNCAGILGESFQGIPPLALWAALVRLDAGGLLGPLEAAGLISPEVTAAGSGVASARAAAGTYSVRAIASGAGVLSAGVGAGAERAPADGAAAIGALGAAVGATGTALASSFPQPRQNL